MIRPGASYHSLVSYDIIDYSVELCNSRPSHESEFNAHRIQVMNVYECNGKNIFIR